ncbi:MAG: DMT family transporter [Methylobacterium sp.]
MAYAILWALAAALLAGMAQATQAVYNAAIARAVGGALPAAVLSMVIAAGFLILIGVARQIALPTATAIGSIAPYPLLVGGACGAIILSCVLFALPQIGSASVVALFILGQLVASLLLDHFAVLGIAPHPISLQRLVGAAVILGGTCLVISG